MSRERYFGGIFPNESALWRAITAATECGFTIHDVYSPYPVHGIEEIPGFGHSHIAWIGGIAGFAGLVFAMLFEFWASTVDWPLIIGGKPMNSWPAFVPAAFEVMILFAGIVTVISLVTILRMLSRRKHPHIGAALDDKFVLVFEAGDASFNPVAARNIMKKYGALTIWENDDIIEQEELFSKGESIP